ncbi:DUF5994 family protein [Actinokineospora sp. PR83]|uniref:DUF5994 family protein n=1 Tax=Actinokineospora sp. PR83 TaxID=2884908 RepID=UPI001F3E951A|nr:DUF5994 family protein [Actinokineospora sp. PR83]MCG8916055.1 DUF5994 family protein [Actinokineospora sp. PR83]
MNSDLHNTPTAPTTGESRLALKPRSDDRGGADGGWWPRSTDPDTEFPTLITALAARGVPVRRVSYNLDAWDAGERRLTVDGVLVRLEGFHSTPEHVVTVIGPDRTRTRLLVIPHDTADGTAETALHTAGDPTSTATDRQVLGLDTTPDGPTPASGGPAAHSRATDATDR